MPENYPNLEAFEYGFHRGELTVARRKFTAISGVSFAQPTEEGVVKGTRPYPIGRTEGSMDMGEGTITLSTESSRTALIELLASQALPGFGYRNVIFGVTWVLYAPGAPLVKVECRSCRILDNAYEHEEGPEALGGDVQFSFLEHLINGHRPHG